MTDKPAGIDYRETVFLPKTDFAMKAGLPEREPALLKRWEDMGLYGKLREQSRGKPKYVRKKNRNFSMLRYPQF